MPSLGDRLRKEREHRSLTVQQAAEATKIKADHIRAIEAGEWSVFTAHVYVRGFVKTYARYLRLPEPEIVTQLEEELAGRGDFIESSRPGGLHRGPLDFVMLKLALVRWQILFPLALGVALLVGGWYGWKSWQARPPRLSTPVPARLYQPKSTLTTPTLSLPPVTNTPAPVKGSR